MQECGRKTFNKSKMRMKVDQYNSPGDYTTYMILYKNLKYPYILALYLFIEIFNRDYWIIYCLSYDCEMLYELDLYCSQIICSAPCLSDWQWCGRIIQINSEHSLKIMSCSYNDIIAQVDFNIN